MSSSDSVPNQPPAAAPLSEADEAAKALKKKEREAAKAAKDAKKNAKFEAKKASQTQAASAPADAAKKEKKEKKPKAGEDDEYVNTTPAGQKKDMTAPFASKYNPVAVESAWYSWWEQQGFFRPPEPIPGKKEETFVISIPPPNVTGSLHLGHALTSSIQDTLTRWSRMHGKSALYIPGCDHAGIATQIVVEKKLMREKKLTRHDLGREEFIKQVWIWKNQYGDRIYEQFKRLGISVDWDRVAFTMDPGPSHAVATAFIRLQEEGVIYRDNRLVNWCTKLKTAISNLEVENKELEGSTWLAVPDHAADKKYEFGVIISFAYKIENSDEEIVVATTRVETMLGDTAIAVHPEDGRYTHLVGKFAVHPFNSRKIPIVADTYVEKDFGTGAVKITPAHDPNDYALGKRHNLQFINIFTDDGKVNHEGGQFEGLQRFDARNAIIKELQSRGLYRDKQNNKMQIPICTRSGNIVEPMMKPQWWVNCKDMAAAAINAVKSGELEIIPKTSERDWFLWLEKIQDWCISRQLWWGHRVPAYLIRIDGKTADEFKKDNWVSALSEEEAYEKAYARFPKISREKITLEQDPDVLDTWFSSGLWPFSILGWPKKTLDLDRFYPNALLETGHDILFFWVARMVMMGIKLTGQVPFKQVFCHAMVRDAHGRKMSKSLGNVIDPLDVIEGIALLDLQKRLEEGNLDPKEVTKAKDGQKRDFPNGIPQCGTDALRFALLAYTTGGRDINLDILRVEGYRKFCNKLWNATRLALMKLGEDFIPKEDALGLTGHESLSDLWILNKLNIAVAEVNAHLEQRNFMAATTAAYNFWLYEFCDVYLEISKPIIGGPDAVRSRAAQETLYTCLDAGLKLLHPMMPFVTEELWQRLNRRPNDPLSRTIMLAKYPTENPAWSHPKADEDFEAVNKVVRAARSLVSNYNIPENWLYVQTSNAALLSILQRDAAVITEALVKNAKSLQVLTKDESAPAGCAVVPVSEDCNVYLLVKGKVDFDVELAKLQAQKEKALEQLAELRKKTEAPGYEKKVKLEVREANAAKIKTFEAEIETVTTAFENFVKLRDE
ncbi:tRNA synthetases class I-domain-containing protein [Zopfochytrium polystomum]|nr:tRNA synthetases class I-domain-containing protein [Zopfochytrium polystomum]